LRIAGAKPTVDTVTERCEIPRPDGDGSVIVTVYYTVVDLQ